MTRGSDSNNKTTGTYGGFYTGWVGGNQSFNVNGGGDIVAGNKTTSTTTRTGLDAATLEKLGLDIGQVVAVLHGMREQVDKAELGKDDRYDLLSEITGCSKQLRELSEQIKALPPGNVPPTELTTQLTKSLQGAEAVGKRVASLVDTAKELGLKLAPVVNSVSQILGLA